MSKSNYPNKLDTSVEIPVVRDNITEIGSDVLNSLRDAIFNIERTLGINPQGVAGNTLASRLSNLIDENGNIKDEALAKAGLLSGPISDKDVSKTAAIKEFKLDLDYPTTLLQDEISILNSKIQEFIVALNELNAIVSAHVNENAINRHFAKAITVEAADISPSDSALNDIEAQGLQEFIQALFDSHISYTGEGISEDNNSHKANQIFYDNTENSDLISSSSVQGAIDDLADIEGKGLRSSILDLNSNGRIRTGSQTDIYEGNESGSLITEFSEIVYTDYVGLSRTEVSFSDSPELLLDIENFDILEISESLTEEDNGDYVIASFEKNLDGTLDSVSIFGGPKGEFSTGTLGRIKKSPYQTYNRNGLNCSVRPRAGFSNTPSVQACLPNAATLISFRGQFEKLESGVYENISIEIDGADAVEIPVYNSSYNIHNIDIVVSIINRYCVQNNLNIFAYKLRTNSCYELAISHNIPNHPADNKARSLKIVESSSLDAYEVLGFSNLLDKEVRGSYGNSFNINGSIVSEFGLVQVYGGSSISISSGTTTIETLELNFLDLGIRAGDLCVIEGSSDSTDDGTYSIRSVESSRVDLDYTTSVFGGEASADTQFTFIRSTAPITELDFIDVNGSVIVDIFADDGLSIHYNRRADIVGSFNSANFFLVVTDFSKNFITEDETYVLRVKNDGLASIKISGGSYGDEVFVGSTGEYVIPSEDGFEFIKVKVFVPNESLAIFASSQLTIDITGRTELPESVIHLSRCLFSPEFGIVIEDIDVGSGEIGAVGLIDKRISGTIDDTIISEPFIERYIQGPRNELRSSGFIRGFNLTNLSVSLPTTEITLSIGAGVAIVNGIRVEFLGKENITFNYSNGSSASFYVAIDNEGCIKISNEADKTGGTDYVSPFSPEANLHIAYFDSSDVEIYDLRFYVDRVDYKILNQLIVSPEDNFGQFKTLKRAVKYCEVFSSIFKGQFKPKIILAPGLHIVDSQISFDFDLEIEGCGPESIVQRGPNYLLETERQLFQIGNQSGTNKFVYGARLSNFTYQGVDGIGAVQLASTIVISHNIAEVGNSLTASFSIDSIRFSVPNYGPLNSNAWSEFISIGTPSLPAVADPIFQNVSITNCYFNNFGFYFSSGNNGIVFCSNINATNPPTYRNIVVSNSTRDLSLFQAAAWTYVPVFINVAGGATIVENLLEVNNVSIES